MVGAGFVRKDADRPGTTIFAVKAAFIRHIPFYTMEESCLFVLYSFAVMPVIFLNCFEK